jgi:predicted NBD/HSP70 family sugar kinase
LTAAWVEGATHLLRSLLDMGDEYFGPSRSALESGPAPQAVVGSETMRDFAWVTVRTKFERAAAEAKALVAVYSSEIETLADTLLTSKAMLSGDEIVAVVGELRNRADAREAD